MKRDAVFISVVLVMLIAVTQCTPLSEANEKEFTYDFRMFVWGVPEQTVMEHEPATFYLRWHDSMQQFVLSFQTEALLGEVQVPLKIDYIFDGGNRLVSGEELYLVTDSGQEALVAYDLMKRQLQKKFGKKPEKKQELRHVWTLKKTIVTLSMFEENHWLFVSVHYLYNQPN